MTAPTLLPSLPPEGALCSGPAEPDPRKRLDPLRTFDREGAMQFVMRRDLWLAEGGWRNHAAGSDGVLYQGFARKYHIRSVPAVLGEHW